MNFDDEYDYDYDSSHQLQLLKDKIKTTKDLEELKDIFKTVDLHDTTYIYLLAQNPDMIQHIEYFMMLYKDAEKEKEKEKDFIAKVIYIFLDGWSDFWYTKRTDKSKYFASEELVKTIRGALVNCLRTFDTRPPFDHYYITYLQKEFSIDFYAETMAG